MNTNDNSINTIFFRNNYSIHLRENEIKINEWIKIIVKNVIKMKRYLKKSISKTLQYLQNWCSIDKNTSIIGIQ